MSKQTTDVDRALAAIGGEPMVYRTFGPRPIPQRNPELDKIFTYNEAGIGEYHPPAVVLAEPEDDAIELTSLAGFPTEQANAALEASSPVIVTPAVAPVQAAEQAAAPAPQPIPAAQMPSNIWRERPAPSVPTSVFSAEERSLAAMFNMLAGKTHGQTPTPQPTGAPATQRQDDNADLFRRL